MATLWMMPHPISLLILNPFSFEMKKLSNNSSWAFEHVLETMDDYWLGQDENFAMGVIQTADPVTIFPWNVQNSGHFE